jgi:hypothetical protein
MRPAAILDGQPVAIPERELWSMHEARNAAARDDAEVVLGRMTSTGGKWVRKASSFPEWMPENSSGGKEWLGIER